MTERKFCQKQTREVEHQILKWKNEIGMDGDKWKEWMEGWKEGRNGWNGDGMEVNMIMQYIFHEHGKIFRLTK